MTTTSSTELNEYNINDIVDNIFPETIDIYFDGIDVGGLIMDIFYLDDYEKCNDEEWEEFEEYIKDELCKIVDIDYSVYKSMNFTNVKDVLNFFNSYNDLVYDKFKKIIKKNIIKWVSFIRSYHKDRVYIDKINVMTLLKYLLEVYEEHYIYFFNIADLFIINFDDFDTYEDFENNFDYYPDILFRSYINCVCQ